MPASSLLSQEVSRCYADDVAVFNSVVLVFGPLLLQPHVLGVMCDSDNYWYDWASSNSVFKFSSADMTINTRIRPQSPDRMLSDDQMRVPEVILQEETNRDSPELSSGSAVVLWGSVGQQGLGRGFRLGSHGISQYLRHQSKSIKP